MLIFRNGPIANYDTLAEVVAIKKGGSERKTPSMTLALLCVNGDFH
jgi:hypothetical protein